MSIAWGIIGAGRIARKFAAALHEISTSKLVAIASRDAARAVTIAADLGAPVAYGSNEQLLADPQIQAVYIGLPNGLHVEWSLKAAQAGKHVLCEKPLAPTAAEAAHMLATARAHNVWLAEAFMYRFHPRTKKLAELVQSGIIGKVQLVRVGFSFKLDRPTDPRWDHTLAGGSLYDVGCYCVNLARFVVGEAPTQAWATARWSASGVDETLAGTLEYPGGAIAQISCSFQGGFQQQAQIIGSDGLIELDQAFSMHPNQQTAIRVWRGTSFAALETLTFEPTNHFRLEIEGFERLIQANPTLPDLPEMPMVETRQNLATIEALLQSSHTGKWTVVVS